MDRLVSKILTKFLHFDEIGAETYDDLHCATAADPRITPITATSTSTIAAFGISELQAQ
jgi:hypothetical protein